MCGDMSADRPNLSVVIPVFRSENLLADTVNELIETLEGGSFEVVLVDDGSPDGSWEVVRRLAVGDARVRGLRLYKNHGQHHAVLAGMSVARGDWVVTIDDDGQNPPSEIKALMDDADGHDVVFGRFREKQAHGMRRFGTSAVRWLNIKVFGMPQDFHVSNVRLIRRDVVDRILSDRTAFPYVTGQALLHSASPSWVYVEATDPDSMANPTTRWPGSQFFSSTSSLHTRSGHFGWPLRLGSLSPCSVCWQGPHLSGDGTCGPASGRRMGDCRGSDRHTRWSDHWDACDVGRVRHPYPYPNSRCGGGYDQRTCWLRWVSIATQ